MKNKLHSMEQHSRRNNLRVFNLPIDGDADDNDNLIDQVYDRALLPILRGAVSKKRLREVPSRDRLICSAHYLPGKDGKPKPIIVRLLNNHQRTVIMQCKKKIAPKALTPPGPGRPLQYHHPIFEDVSTETYRYQQRRAGRPVVTAAWIAGGVIRYRIADSEAVHRVTSVFSPIEKLFE